MYHCLGDCFNPYNDLCSWQTYISFLWTSNPSGCFIRIFSSNLPWRKAVLTSSCSSSKTWFSIIASKTLMDVCLTIGEKISLKSTPYFWLNPLATNLALYLIRSFSERPGFLLNIHLQPTTCIPLGNSTSFQVWFLYRDSISSFVANNQFSTSGWGITTVKVLDSWSKTVVQEY